ncbi:MAG: hypothetical protein Q9169_006092 [Polycauliona sp. 2 TL-2023]
MSTTTTQPVLKRKSAMLNLFVSQKEINKLKAEMQLRQNRRKPSPLPTPAPTPTTTPSAPTPSKPPTPPPATTPTPWTPAEDIALLHLRTLSKPYSEIATTLTPRTEAEVEARWKEIGLPATTAAEGGTDGAKAGVEGGGEPTKVEAMMSGAATAAADGGEAKNKGGKGQKGGKQKGEGKGKGGANQAGNKKGKQKDQPPSTAAAPTQGSAAAPAADNANDDDPPTAFTDPLLPSSRQQSAIIASASSRKIHGILKPGSSPPSPTHFPTSSIPEGATTLNGRPIIYIEESDPLDVSEVTYSLPPSIHHLPFPRQDQIVGQKKKLDYAEYPDVI